MNNIDKFISESIKNYLIETNKIRRLTDDDYPYPQLDNVDFAKMKDIDNKFNDERRNKWLETHDNLKGFNNVDTQMALYHNPQKGIPQTIINDYQKELTNNVQQRAIEKTGSSVQPFGTFNISDTAKSKLGEAGLDLEVKGQVFTYGNTKLPASTMIINLTPAFNCPSVNCPFRKDVCYAIKGERRTIWPQLRNLRNEFTFPYLSVKEILYLLDLYIKSAPCKIHNIRLSEDGDFKSQEVVDFCDKLAGHVYAKYGIKTTCYTHQRFDFTNCKNLIVNSSFPKEMIKGADRNYLMIKREEKDKFDSLIGDGKIHRDDNGELYFKCHCDCKRCNFCYNTKEENGEPQNERVNVYVLQHSTNIKQ